MGKSWLDRIGDVASEIGDVASSVARKVAVAAVEATPVEIRNIISDFSPENIGHLILFADRRGFLNDPSTESLKRVADKLAAGERVEAVHLFQLVPDLLELPVIKGVVPPPIAERLKQTASAAAAAAVIQRMRQPVRRPQRQEPQAPTDEAVPNDAAATIQFEVAGDEPVAETPPPAKPAPRKRAPRTAAPRKAADGAAKPTTRRRSGPAAGERGGLD